MTEYIKSALKKELDFDVLNGIIDSSNFKAAQYLSIISLIENFVLGIFDTYSKKTNQNKESELELNEIKRMLNYKDLRSVNSWCKKNDVFVINQGNSQFVNKHEFILAFYKPFIAKLKTNHENWKDVFMDYLKGNLANLLPGYRIQKKIADKYKPNTTIEKSFLNKIKKL